MKQAYTVAALIVATIVGWMAMLLYVLPWLSRLAEL
jgi:hypothetical protein